MTQPSANRRSTVATSVPQPGLVRSAVRSLSDSSERRTRTASCGVSEDLEQRQLLSVASGWDLRSIDGTGNNLANPELGSTNEQLVRLAAADYANGTDSLAGEDRSSPRAISNVIASQEGDDLNTQGRTDFLWLWGQFLDHDIDLTESADPAEDASISVPTGDEHFDPFGSGTATIGTSRSIYEVDENGVRQQINQISSFIDGSNVYGSDAERAEALREHVGGRLKVTETADGDLLPFNTTGLENAGGTGSNLFLAGDVRANENIYLTAMHTLWVREHNRIADKISSELPGWTDEEIYQYARVEIVGKIQAITYNEWLPALVGDNALSEYEGYDETVDPSIANEFSTAAFRFGHSLLPSTLFTVDEGGELQEVALRDAFFRPDKVATLGVDNLLYGARMGLSSDLDISVVDDLRNFLFGQPGQGGFDLVSLNIQRGRDHGLASYNDTREALGLPRVTSFEQVSSDPDTVVRLAMIYESVDDIDLWVGGLAEDPVSGSMLGRTFQTIVVDQFERLRDGDRYFYANPDMPTNPWIEHTKLEEIIRLNTGAPIWGNVFVDERAKTDDGSGRPSPPSDADYALAVANAFRLIDGSGLEADEVADRLTAFLERRDDNSRPPQRRDDRRLAQQVDQRDDEGRGEDAGRRDRSLAEATDLVMATSIA